MGEKRLQSIDSLRGVAILGVVSVHAALLSDGMNAHLLALASYGARGVQLFFLLSALTLYTISRERPFRATSFYTRRFFRVAPMFYVGAVLYVFFHGSGPAAFSPAGIGFKQIALTLLFLHGFSLDSFNALVPGGWSIACEAAFYVLFPLFLFVLTSLRRSLIALAASFVSALIWAKLVRAALLPGNDPVLVGSFVTFGFLYNLPAFIAGIAIFHALRSPSVKRWIDDRTCRALFAGILCAMVGAALLNIRTPLVATALIALLSYCIFRLQPRWAANRALAWIGIHSFSLYILHFLVLDILHMLIPAGVGGDLRFAALFVGTLAIGLAMSKVTYDRIEKPFVAFGHKLSRRSGMGGSVAPSR